MSKYADYKYLEIYNKLDSKIRVAFSEEQDHKKLGIDFDEQQKYIIDRSVLGAQSREEKIEELRSYGKRYKYVLKTIISGSVLESEIYPVYEKSKDIPRRDKEKDSKESQANLNEKNAIKQFIRITNTNFGKDDLLLTATYEDKYLPTQKQAKKDVTNYIRRIKRYREKNNLPELKYVYVIEYVDEEEQHKSKKIRVHHHIIINKMDRNIAENLWGKGRVEARRLQPDESGLEGIARYMMKQPKGSKRWYGSRNLKKPKVYRSVTRLTKNKTELMAKAPEKLPGMFENLYKGKYRFQNCSPYYSDIVGGFYLYCQMRRRD